ncbi:MAG: hypothetical protein MJH10_20005 [Epibacterium sp.]|nr:hypothetical protein [Epibacterium sp.]NQX75764.1 hypothetical protein [Epibacterium sp.]
MSLKRWTTVGLAATVMAVVALGWAMSLQTTQMHFSFHFWWLWMPFVLFVLAIASGDDKVAAFIVWAMAALLALWVVLVPVVSGWLELATGFHLHDWIMLAIRD